MTFMSSHEFIAFFMSLEELNSEEFNDLYGEGSGTEWEYIEDSEELRLQLDL